jgi:succinate dehydrogenase/fumarate reductase flavoprotein subunit
MTHEVDVVVAGSGSAGMTAAIVAAHGGLKVLLVEKSAYFGGTSAWSGGGCWVPANALMAQVGLSDSKEAARDYASAVVGNHLRRDLFETFLDNAPPMLDFMLKNTAVRFMPRTPAPDYRMDAPGALIGGRSLGSVPYDGRELGANLKLLRPPLREFNAPWGMMMSPPDLMQALQVFKSSKSLWYMTKLFARYGVDLARYGRGTRLTMGNALAARLLKSALDAGVTLWPRTAARRLLRDSQRVTGLVVERDGNEVTILARQGVVLATGGFSANPAMRAAHFPYPEQHVTMVTDGNTGDGLNMAMEAGAMLESGNARNGFMTVISILRRKDGSLQKCPHFFNDLPKPGCIAVNVKGERFGDEAGLELAAAMQATGSVPAWLICDDRFIRRYGLGLVYPFGIRLGKMRRAGYLHQAATLPALAAEIGVDASGLQRTAARHNEFAVTGIDADFGKGSTPLDRTMGDQAQKPNPCLGPIATPPFYAIRIVAGDICSTLGLQVNSLAQPLNAAGEPIAGLHVCGLDMNSLWSGTGFANGAFHAQNMTFGYIIGRTLAGMPLSPSL